MKDKISVLEKRVRKLENTNTKLVTTLNHLTKSFDDFIIRLDKREVVEDIKINNLTKIVYIGIGVLTVSQFLIANNIIKVG